MTKTDNGRLPSALCPEPPLRAGLMRFTSAIHDLNEVHTWPGISAQEVQRREWVSVTGRMLSRLSREGIRRFEMAQWYTVTLHEPTGRKCIQWGVDVMPYGEKEGLLR